MRSCKHDGDDMESTATSASPKWIEGEKLARFGTVNSAECWKPKKRSSYMLPKNIQWSGRHKSNEQKITIMTSSVTGRRNEEVSP